MKTTEVWDAHERFKQLCAFAQCNSLGVRERLELNRHLRNCESCRAAFEAYAEIGASGMAYLASESDLTDEAQRWDGSATRVRLRSSIDAQYRHGALPFDHILLATKRWMSGRSRFSAAFALGVLAACAIIAVTLGIYRVAEKSAPAIPRVSASPSATLGKNVVQRPISGGTVPVESATALRQTEEISAQREELTRLDVALGEAEKRVSELDAAQAQKEEALRQLTAERDQLSNRLSESEKAYELLQASYTSLRDEHNRHLLRMASLEADLTDLKASNNDQEARLRNDEQFLASDRDIRELMGARKLYIADVFDVDSVSRTRKPFGRVFYTESKSLVFYAFDLDHQPGVKNASVFQVWGQRDAEISGAPHPMNLGILYMDSETSRRWVLRSDDPKQLAQIDAVFVTVEPHGGSQKPTGKPLLYALLRKEVNHP